jgi:succinate--hydroxymethylglutarate CoA-transferase
MVAPAVMYDGARMPVRLPPPWLGEHTWEVLAELGYSKEQVEGFKAKGVV